MRSHVHLQAARTPDSPDSMYAVLLKLLYSTAFPRSEYMQSEVVCGTWGVGDVLSACSGYDVSEAKAILFSRHKRGKRALGSLVGRHGRWLADAGRAARVLRPSETARGGSEVGAVIVNRGRSGGNGDGTSARAAAETIDPRAQYLSRRNLTSVYLYLIPCPDAPSVPATPRQRTWTRSSRRSRSAPARTCFPRSRTVCSPLTPPFPRPQANTLEDHRRMRRGTLALTPGAASVELSGNCTV